jgi:hypothetical protein
VLKEDRQDSSTSSRVTRTIDTANDCHYVDIDLGECFLEAPDEDGNPVWYAFSSIEISLLDEDANSGTETV